MASELNIRWDNYSNDFVSDLREFLKFDELTDVTICADGQQIKAHRVFLAVSSSYFRDLFKSMIANQQHTYVCLKDVPFHILKNIIDLVYGGHVKIPEANFEDFVKAAKFLQIHGFEEMDALETLKTCSDDASTQIDSNFSLRDCYVKLDRMELANKTTSKEEKSNSNKRTEMVTKSLTTKLKTVTSSIKSIKSTTKPFKRIRIPSSGSSVCSSSSCSSNMSNCCSTVSSASPF